MLVSSHSDWAPFLSWSKPVSAISLMSLWIPLGHHLILRSSTNIAQGKEKPPQKLNIKHVEIINVGKLIM